MPVHHGALTVSQRGDALYRQARAYLERDNGEQRIFTRLEREPHAIHLRLNFHDNDSYDASTRTIHWDPYSALRTTRGGRQSPALGLGHEADHAVINSGRAAPGWNKPLKAYDNAEERRVIRGSEAHAARTLGEAARRDHRGSTYRVASPADR
ncbi:MAG: hypothetical protein NVSMB31_12990 [Vulcanimicrobiaceae bacterium]